MQEVIELMKHILNTELAAGKYLGLFILSLAVLYFCAKKEMLYYGIISLAAAVFPVTAYFFVQKFGISSYYWELLWIIPIPLTISYAGSLLVEGAEKKKRLIAVIGCIVLTACAGTMLPYKGDAVKVKYKDKNVEQAIFTVIEQKEILQEEIVLLAPKEIMERARRFDADLQLLYGRDMWSAEVKTGIADTYTADKQALFEKMETDYLYPEEIAEQAGWYGCNVLVLREKIPEESVQYSKWELAESLPGYLVYRILN